MSSLARATERGRSAHHRVGRRRPQVQRRHPSEVRRNRRRDATIAGDPDAPHPAEAGLRECSGSPRRQGVRPIPGQQRRHHHRAEPAMRVIENDKGALAEVAHQHMMMPTAQRPGSSRTLARRMRPQRLNLRIRREARCGDGRVTYPRRGLRAAWHRRRVRDRGRGRAARSHRDVVRLAGARVMASV